MSIAILLLYILLYYYYMNMNKKQKKIARRLRSANNYPFVLWKLTKWQHLQHYPTYNTYTHIKINV
jgi:hypothetical protein